MLSIVTWKWRPAPGYRSVFAPETVNVLARMVRRHYPHPHRMICVTDDRTGIGEGVEILPLWNDFADIPSPHLGNNPSCYRRLRMWHPEAAQWFGGRFVSIDLDCVITGDLTPLWDRPEDLVLWGDTNPTTHYNGSMVLMSAGCRPHVWQQFDPQTSPRRAKNAGQFGSDQGWFSYVLGPGEARWTRADGVYSFRCDIVPNDLRRLPTNARIIMFHGHHDPWGAFARQNCPWLTEAYC